MRQTEIRDLALAWVLISIAFAIVLRNTADLLTVFLLSLLTAGLGFVIHELAHKYVAQKYGKHATFVADYRMLALSILIAFTGIIIAAPGAVMISGFVSREENGIISAAGPASNIVLALLFLPFFYVLSGTWSFLASMGVVINSWLAMFNMIPFGFFDGAKILNWNKTAYISLAATSVLLVFISSTFVLSTL